MSAEQFGPPSEEDLEDLATARALIEAGIPVFAARPALKDGAWDPTGGTDGCGYWLPTAWQKTVPSDKWLNPNAPGYEKQAWRPGWALGAVMGRGLDLLDVDPRNGGDSTRVGLLQAGMWPTSYADATTPSGGTHDFIASLGVGSRDGVQPGLDVKGGYPDGEGRGFAFIAPTLKLSKTTYAIERYRWARRPALDALTDGQDDSGEAVAELVRQARGSKSSKTGEAGAGGGDPFEDDAAQKHTGPIPYGKRHAALVSYAGRLRSKSMSADEARVLMKVRWLDCAQPPEAQTPCTWDEAQDKLDDVYKRYPAGDSRAEHAAEDGDASVDGPEGAVSAAEASWGPVDLGGFLDGSYVAVEPTLLRRTDSIALLYPGLVHSFHGESESGKSLLLQIEAARLVTAGEDVLFIDFESDAGSVARRLVTFGAPVDEVLKHFHYVRPHAAPDSSADERHAWNALLEQRYALAVIDGVTDALTIFNYKTKENDDITAWMRRFPRRLADRTGAAVALVDHVTKDSDTRGRFAIGGQAKMNGLTGAAYTVEIHEPLGIGLRGEIVLRVGKDRPGQVRAHCGPARKSDRTQEAARVVIDSRSGAPVVTFGPHRDSTTTGVPTAGRFRPTALMERLSLVAERKPGATKNDLAKEGGKNRSASQLAADLLVEEGYLLREPGPNNSQKHTSLKPYRRALDPLDDDYPGAGTTDDAERGGAGSGPYTGGPGTTTRPGSEDHPEPPGTAGPGGASAGSRGGPLCGRCGSEQVQPYVGGDRLCPSCRAEVPR